MASNKNTTPPVPKPGLSGRPQSHLDWNTRRKPALTPRREYMPLMRRFGILLTQPVAISFGPVNGGGVIQ